MTGRAWWLEPHNIRISIPHCEAVLVGCVNGTRYRWRCISPKGHRGMLHQSRFHVMFTLADEAG